MSTDLDSAEIAAPTRAQVAFATSICRPGRRFTPTPIPREWRSISMSRSAVTPGQAAVFYSGDLVLGGGWIE